MNAHRLDYKDAADARDLYNTAVDLHRKGLTAGAIEKLREATEIDPYLGEAQFLLGCLLEMTGELDDSLYWLTNYLAANSNHAPSLVRIGNIHKAKNDLVASRRCYEQALEVNPDFPEAHYNLAIVLDALGEIQPAIRHYTSAISLSPRMSEAYYNLGNLSLRIGCPERAVSCYRKAIEVNPQEHRAFSQIGNIYYEKWGLDMAERMYRRALEACPTSYEANHNLGNVLRLTGRIHDAIGYYRKAALLKPDSDQVHVSLGNAYRASEKLNEAMDAYQTALGINPESLAALKNLGVLFGDLGKTDQAIACFDKALSLQPDISTQIKKIMTLPIIYPSQASMEAARRRFLKGLEGIENSGLSINDPHKEIGMSNFILALHGKDEKAMRERIAQFYLSMCKDLDWISPFTKKSRRKCERIKLGIVCKYLYNHTIGRLYHGLIERIDKRKFHLTIFRFDPPQDELAKRIDRHAEEVVSLPHDLFAARRVIAEHTLDILFYPEIGMDPLTYFIAFSRLAPVQIKRGFQITSGIPNMDYFISSKAAEPADGQDHYTEKLIKLNGTGYYYMKPAQPKQMPSRTLFGLPEKGNLYACPQSLFKIHPDFDVVVDSLLKADPDGFVVLIEGLHEHWKKLLLNRLRATIGKNMERIVFIPRQPRERFMSFCMISDAVIDTIYFSGGNTSLECFAWGIPVVTWPSRRLPGRLTYGFYKKMGVMDCVATDLEAYIEIAVRLANDPEWKTEIGRRIGERSAALFENEEDVREVERVFEAAVERAYPTLQSAGEQDDAG